LKNELPDEFWKGIEEFNAGKFFECHETLEAVWAKQSDPERELTQGIIQIAVAYYHLGRQNPKGALKLFERGLARVQKFPSPSFGMDTEKLIEEVKATQRAIGACHAAENEFSKLPRIEILPG